MGIFDYVSDRRILFLLLIVLALGALDVTYGGPHFLHFGIEFIGGTQIPITLEQSVTPDQMSNLIGIMQQRVSTFGLKQVSVEGIGSSALYVTIPSVSPTEINSTINIIQSQGVFQGLVNYKEALNGTSILSGSIGTVPPSISGSNVSWSVTFYLTPKGTSRFSKVVFGQGYQPLYLFLDRPLRTIVLLNSSLYQSSATSSGITSSQAITTMQSAVTYGNTTIPLQLLSADSSNWNLLYPYFASHNKTYSKVVLAKNTPANIISALQQLNYSLSFKTPQNMTPQFEQISTGTTATISAVQTWPAIGLLSAPRLDPSVTNGTSGSSYVISGASPSNLSLTNKINFATQESKTIASILSGGALPVKVIVGAPTTIPATLGTKFLLISGVAALLAIVAVVSVIAIRYRKPFLVIPIILTVLAELFIIVSVIGLLGTIDLAAVAGMIAVVGTGVDAQIIITDEVLTQGHESGVKSRLKNAFYIVWVDAALIIIAMLPLLFSTSLVSVIGFSESTIMGAILGILITRPAYGAIVSRHYEKGEQGGKTLSNVQ
ncbi:MAG: hypothetical protein KGH53_01920 [Candidatus Micrarchaeota archaeon]|nr:hypothetical protein [Candidatus Micrarchaeota archaeon]